MKYNNRELNNQISIVNAFGEYHNCVYTNADPQVSNILENNPRCISLNHILEDKSNESM